MPGVYARLDKGFGLSAAEESTLRDLISVHWVRSVATRHLYDRIVAEQTAASSNRLMRQGPVLDAEFRRRTGLWAAGPGARQWLVEDAVRTYAPAMAEALFAAKMVEYHNRFRDHCQLQQLEIHYSADPLVIGDCPVIAMDPSTGGLGPHQGVAVLDARHVWMPISSRIVVALANQAAVGEFGADATRVMNRFQMRSAIGWVATEPGDDGDRIIDQAVSR